MTDADKTADELRRELAELRRRRDEALRIAAEWRDRCDELRREIERLREKSR
jgi:uncharacterized coiled-coil DUF342 family protein